jgi:hypothetical protein
VFCNLCGVLIPDTFILCFLLYVRTGVNHFRFVANSEKERVTANEMNI